MDKREFMRKMMRKEDEAEEESLMRKGDIYRDRNDGPLPEAKGTFPHNRYPQVSRTPPVLLRAGPMAVVSKVF